MSTASVRSNDCMRTVGAQYDFSKLGGAVGDFPLGIRVPSGARVIDAFAVVKTAATSTNSTATIAVKVEAANDIFTAAAVSGAPWSTTGRKQGIPDYATVADTKVTTAEREVTMTVAVEALTAGVIDFYVTLCHLSVA